MGGLLLPGLPGATIAEARSIPVAWAILINAVRSVRVEPLVELGEGPS